ncbi:uncharacterized protein LOC117099834 [Anneissia japonica]|uniref:uncharacterized protein LOC117099834 n=1 Tax=Anneissia japonica TaxID=1529436 RepID=UPI0014257A06|nr:uncharacterized protein LOC117099834 [Anneissia japonica]
MSPMSQFQIGQEVEVLDDETGVWRAATITGINLSTNGNRYGVHYRGWQPKHDTFKFQDCIRNATQVENLGKRQPKRKSLSELPSSYKRLHTIKPEHLTEGDVVYFMIGSEQYQGNVIVNDPFLKTLNVSYDTSRGSGDVNIVDVTIGYSDVVDFKEQDRANPEQPKAKLSTARKPKRCNRVGKTNHIWTDNTCSTDSANIPNNNHEEEITHCIFKDEIVSIGSFLATTDNDIHHFVTSMVIGSNGSIKATGYKVRKLGTDNLLMIGSFSNGLDNPKIIKPKLNAKWIERRRSTQRAAEERVKTLLSVKTSTYEQRKASLRTSIRQEVQRSLSSKKRQARFRVLYEQGIDAKLFGLNAGNMFREEYSPESFHQLDSLLGSGWDYRMKKDSDRYSFVSRFDIKLIIEERCMEIVAHLCNISTQGWSEDYRSHVLQEVVNANQPI